MIFPNSYTEPLVVIHPWSMESLGNNRGGLNGCLDFSAVQGSASVNWPSANLAIFVPFTITKPIIVQNMFVWIISGTPTGNIDVGIYDSQGNRLFSSGSTAFTGSNIKKFSVSSLQLAAGIYYLAEAHDTSGTNTATMNNSGTNAAMLQMLGLAQMASAFPLPATATFASITNALLPGVALSTRSVV